MKISPLLNRNLPLVAFQSNVKPAFLRQALNSDSFVKSQKSKDYISLSKFLALSGKVKVTDYIKIYKTNPRLIALFRDYCENIPQLRTKPVDVAKSALCIKNYFNQKYGDNYRIISVGTSPAIICEALEKINCDVVYLPISKVSQFHCSFKPFDEPKLEDLKSVRDLFKYIKTKGVNKKDKKMNIFIDYCSSGSTLSEVARLANVINKVPNERIVQESLIGLLDNSADLARTQKKLYLVDDEAITNINLDVFHQNIQVVSSVPHNDITQNLKKANKFLDFKADKKMRDKFEEYSTPSARAFSFCVIDELSYFVDFFN